MPAVSVILPVLNPDPSQFREAVHSVLSQTWRDLEMIVIEDPAERSAEAVLAEFADPRLRFHKNRQRGTLASARNLGMNMATADLVAMQDADDVSEPTRLEVQARRMQTEPDLVVLGAQIECIDAAGQHLGFRPYPTGHDDIVRAMRRFNAIAHPTVMLRRDVVLAAGGYSEATDYACEDYELWSRLATAGKRFANCPESLVRYRVHPGGMKHRLLRATLRDTLRIKRAYWWEQMTVRDRLRAWGERVLLGLPASWVMGLFLRVGLRQNLPHSKTG
jgi:glycosyltransferase involved in cell wall biosynthesis